MNIDDLEKKPVSACDKAELWERIAGCYEALDQIRSSLKDSIKALKQTADNNKRHYQELIGECKDALEGKDGLFGEPENGRTNLTAGDHDR